MQCEYYALEGLTDLVNTIRKVHANFNTSIRIIGILRVMFDSRITLSQQVSAQLEEHFKDKVFRSIIPRNIRLAEAPSHGMPGVNFDPSSRGAMGYVEFANELIERMPQFRVGPAAGAPAQTAAAAGGAATTPAGAAQGPGMAAAARAGTTPGQATGGATVPAAQQPSQPGTMAREQPTPRAPLGADAGRRPDSPSMSAPTYAPQRMGAGYPGSDAVPSGPGQPAAQPWQAGQATVPPAVVPRGNQATNEGPAGVAGDPHPTASHGEQQR